jgi:hypothetical protein
MGQLSGTAFTTWVMPAWTAAWAGQTWAAMKGVSLGMSRYTGVISSVTFSSETL